jgi:predicted dehydrogenase
LQEKPLGATIEECNIMEKAAQSSGMQVQVNQWQRSAPHFIDAMEYMHSGKLGEIRLVKTWIYTSWLQSVPIKPNSQPPMGVDYDSWLGPAPKRPFNENRFHFDWRWFWDYGGGLMSDWGVHLIDVALWGMKAKNPKSITSMGGKLAYPNDAMETPDTQQTLYDFGDFNILWEHGIGINKGNLKDGNGIAFIGNKGTLVVTRSGWEVLGEEWRREDDKLERYKIQPIEWRDKGKVWAGQIHGQNFINAIQGKEKLNCPIEVGAHVARVSHMGNIAMRVGQQIDWDADKGAFKQKEANKYLKPDYRKPYSLPKV